MKQASSFLEYWYDCEVLMMDPENLPSAELHWYDESVGPRLIEHLAMAKDTPKLARHAAMETGLLGKELKLT